LKGGFIDDKMEIQKQDLINLKSPKQMSFIYQLIQSSVFSKKEFESFYKHYFKKIITSKDASVFIDDLITTITARKRFLNKKHRANIKCNYCSSVENVRRFFDAQFRKEIRVCAECEESFYRTEHSGQTSYEDNPVKDAETIEASADLHKKYDFDTSGFEEQNG